MRQSNNGFLAAAAAILTACGGGEAGTGRTSAWSLDPRIADIGAGIPFCEAAMSRVAEYMGQFEGQTPPDDRYGGTEVAAAKAPLSGGMNGHVSQQQETAEHQNFINLMTLVQYDSELNPVPYLAESWEVSDDNTTLTFHLRDDVYWHDGELTDAYDVAYTYRRSIDPESGFPNAGWFTYYDQEPGVWR